MNDSKQIVQKLWNYCNVLRDAGLSYGDYIEQLTYLLFLKMAHERKQLQPERAPHIPEGYEWPDLLDLEGDPLEIHYRKTLETLGRETGMLGEDLLKRDKVNLDIFWLKDESLEDSANLPDPDVIAAEITEDLEAALDQFSQIASDLKR